MKFFSNEKLLTTNNKNYNNNENSDSKFNLLNKNQTSLFTPNNLQILPRRKLILPPKNEIYLTRPQYKSSCGKENKDLNNFTVDLDKILRGDDKRTTLMIKNVPNKYNIIILKDELNYHYEGKYDFLYLPLDPSNNCNLGFAFINLLDPMQILLFYDIFTAKRWQKFNSLKVIDNITKAM